MLNPAGAEPSTTGIGRGVEVVGRLEPSLTDHLLAGVE